MQEFFTAELELRVRYAETDAMGVVHHASYIVYLEEARSHYARLKGHSYAEFEKSGYYLVVSGVQVRYLGPARYDDILRVRCWVSEIKSRQVIFQYEVCRQPDGQVLARATTRHICTDASGTITRIPSQWQSWWE